MVDPTGEIAGLLGVAGAIFGGMMGRRANIKYVGTGYAIAFGVIAGFGAGYLLGVMIDVELIRVAKPVWALGGRHPRNNENILISQWRDNVKAVLMSKAAPGPDPNDPSKVYTLADAELGAEMIADAYVQAVLENTRDVRERGNGYFGVGGGDGVVADFDFRDETLMCNEWATVVYGALQAIPNLDQTGWSADVLINARMHTHTFHNYVTVSFRGRKTASSISTPDWALDPWLTGRPAVVRGDELVELYRGGRTAAGQTIDPGL